MEFLKSMVYRRYTDKVQSLKWSDVFSLFGLMGVENILKLIDLINSLPPTSVQNETAFNQMKLIKTDRRHRLSNYNLNAAMVMRIESPSIQQYDTTAAINIWMITPSGQKRRTTYKRASKTATETVTAMEREHGTSIGTVQLNQPKIVIDTNENEPEISIDTVEVESEIHIDIVENEPLFAIETVEKEPETASIDTVENYTEIAIDSVKEPEPAATDTFVNEPEIAIDLEEEPAPDTAEEIESETTNTTQSVVKDDDSGEMSDESDFEFEQSENENFEYIVKFAAEE